MYKTKSSRGFAHLGLVIGIVIVVAAIAFGGWFVWDTNKDNNKQQNSSQSNNSQNQPSDPSEGGKYLVIAEWGVKIPLNDEIREAYYTLSSDSTSEYVSLYDAAFDSLKNANGVSCGQGTKYVFYAITRTTPQNAASASEGAGPEFKEFPFTKEYVFGGLGAHQAPPACANLNPDPYGPVLDDENIFDIANDKERAFDAAFQGLKKVE